MHHANAFSSHNVPRWEGVFRSQSNHKQGLETICSAMPYKWLLNCYFCKQILKTTNLVKRFLKWSLRTAHCPGNLRRCVLTRQRSWKKYCRGFSQPPISDLDPCFSIMFTWKGFQTTDHVVLLEFLIQLVSVEIKYCISIKFPGIVGAAGPGTTFWKPFDVEALVLLSPPHLIPSDVAMTNMCRSYEAAPCSMILLFDCLSHLYLHVQIQLLLPGLF